MKGARLILVVLGAVAIVAMLAGLPVVMGVRHRGGDIYPPYSSLRADPLGTKVLFDALERSGMHRVSRTFQRPERMDVDPDTALLYLGDELPPSDWAVFRKEDVAGLTAHVRKGVRAVVMLQPRNVEPKASGTNATRKACAGGSFKGMTNGCEECDGEDAEVGARRGARAKKFISLGDWLDVGLVDVPVKGTQTVYLAEGVAMGGLPSELPCQTSVCFTNVGADWVAIYRRGANPVMIERQIGKGSIVLSSLSFPVSNEGLQEAPHPALITWLMGGRRNVVFDETHLGIVDEPGIVELLRRNGLYGFLAAFVGLALLYVWRQSVPLAPPYGEGDRGDGASAVARDSLSGLASLLRQHVARDGVLGVCLAEWRKTAGKQRVEPALAQRIASVVESCSKSPAGDYNAISRMMLEEVKPYAGAKRRRKPDEPR